MTRPTTRRAIPLEAVIKLDELVGMIDADTQQTYIEPIVHKIVENWIAVTRE
jgi:hypothetical protein